jgi:hypothetical protein
MELLIAFAVIVAIKFFVPYEPLKVLVITRRSLYEQIYVDMTLRLYSIVSNNSI